MGHNCNSSQNFITPFGGRAIELMNLSGVAIRVGDVVQLSAASLKSFTLAIPGSTALVGVSFEDVEPGELCWVVTAGPQPVNLESGTGCTATDVLRMSSLEPGRVVSGLSGAIAGQALQTVVAGTSSVLCNLGIQIPGTSMVYSSLTVGNLSVCSTIGTAATPGELRTLSPGADRTVCNALGFWAEGDGGGGTFVYDASSVAPDNGGTVITASGSGRWIRFYEGPLDIKWFGAKGDFTDDCSLAIQQAIDAAPYGGVVLISDGYYKLTSGLHITDKNVTVKGVGGQGIVDGPLAVMPILRCTDAAATVFAIDPVASSRQVVLEGFIIYGGLKGISMVPSAPTGCLAESRFEKLYLICQTPGGTGTLSYGIEASGGQNLLIGAVIRDVTIYNPGVGNGPDYGISVIGDDAVNTMLFDNVTIRTTVVAGVYLKHNTTTANSGDCCFVKPLFEGNFGIGIHIIRSEITLISPWFEAQDGDDIKLESGGSGLCRATITGGHIHRDGGHIAQPSIRFATDRCQLSCCGTYFTTGMIIDGGGYVTHSKITLLGLPFLPVLINNGSQTAIIYEGRVYASEGICGGLTLAAYTTLGVIVGKMAIRDASGAVQGYVPVYASVT